MGSKMRSIFTYLMLGVVAVALICSAVQATDVDITVKDADDGSYIKGASVYINDHYEGKTDSDGEFSYEYDGNSRYTLKVTKSGYEDWDDRIDDDERSVVVRMDRGTVDFTVSVYDAGTVQPIKGARVDITGQSTDFDDYERTDAAGCASFDLEDGEEYSIEISADDYAEITREIEVDGDTKSVQYWLYPEGQFAFRVADAKSNSPIGGATVKVDGKSVGTTDANGVVTMVLNDDGYYDVEVTHPSYLTYSKEVHLGENVVLEDILLTKSTASLFVSVFDMEKKPIAGAKVVVDGKDAGTTDAFGRLDLDAVVAGTHSFEVSASGYVGQTKSLKTGEGTSDLVFELVRAKVPVSVLVENPSHEPVGEVKICVNGAAAGSTSSSGMLSLDLAPGTYNITGTMDGYHEAVQETAVKAGSSGESVVLTLEPVGLPLGIIALILIVVVAVVAVAGVVATGRVELPNRRKPGRRAPPKRRQF
ncbi:PEGA domain-containing protein [Methanofollis formosanus]|uniref:PEGA domain-containing protein n=1 Tax=Methanofollis formosanus TaxID=299308 RepID=A0A8G1A0C0_9EURY|nr:carboxypeptidase regulatory-like domain-containing protein [Methanofollis formosanus]QYZ79114.1 PEGA domain-containing protein [Methanofollis formosanus]